MAFFTPNWKTALKMNRLNPGQCQRIIAHSPTHQQADNSNLNPQSKLLIIQTALRRLNHSMSEKFKMRDGDTMLTMRWLRIAPVLHFSPNIEMQPHHPSSSGEL